MTTTPISFFYDDFNDNTTDFERWQLLQVNGATASETNQRLQVTVPSGSGWAQAGYVTEKAYTLNEHIVKVDVPSCGNLNQMTLQICKTKVTSEDPYGQNNWYRIQKTDYAHFRIQRKIGGGPVETLTTFTSVSHQLVIKIQDDPSDRKKHIKFYDDINLSNLRHDEEYAIKVNNEPDCDCFVYVFTSSQRDSAYGTGAFDDFAISPVIVTLNYMPDDYNCFHDSTRKGAQGITIWGPVDLPSPIAKNGGVSTNLVFTPTQPKCYSCGDFCNVTFRIHADETSADDIGPITMALWIRTYPLPGWGLVHYFPYYISRTAGHDATLTIDISQIPGYDDTRQMSLTFVNDDTEVDVQIKELQIVRGYSMFSLVEQEKCSGDQTQDGSFDFATRHDYPCNYDKCGGMSFTGFSHDNHYFQQIVNGNQPDGAILEPGTTYSWNWTNPSATFPWFQGNTNYVAKSHSLFNFNNVVLCDDNGNENVTANTNDVPFNIKINNSDWVTFYNCNNNHPNSNSPHGIDLATHEYLKNYYNDAPDASNTLYLLIPDNPDPEVNLFLKDGETGLINLYRVYETKSCCPTISTETTGSGTISPSGGPFPIPEQGKTFDMTASGGGYLTDVKIDDTSKGPVDPYTVYQTDPALDYENRGMEGHEIHAYFSSCEPCEVCQPCLACFSCYIGCMIGCEIECQDCQTTCEVSCQTGCELCQESCQLSCQGCYGCYTCQPCEGCQVTCAAGCYDCQTCYFCYSSCYECEACESIYSCCQICQDCQIPCQPCETCQPCQICQPCEGCQTCQVCQPCESCQPCETCQPCEGCQVGCAAGCYDCQTCYFCYSSCYDCEACYSNY